MIVDEELERALKEVTVAYLKYYPSIYLDNNKKHHLGLPFFGLRFEPGTSPIQAYVVTIQLPQCVSG
jgi:hypothetical protein